MSWDLMSDEQKELHRKLCEEEEKTVKELQTLMSRHCHLDAKVKNIVKVLPNIEMISSDAKHLSDMINYALTLADKVSCKVRKLDTARSRVSECQQRVHDLLDLQLCSDGVRAAMNAGDYEKAAAHVHRYLSMDRSLLEKTADDVDQDSAVVNNSITLLQEASTKLRDILTAKFNDAATNEDVASIERFFKLFPLVEMHDYGLNKYSAYLCTQIQSAARKNLRLTLETSANDKRAGVIFGDVLTLLFEDVARTIEIHQPLVETYYGPGHLIIVVSNLQDECDRQSKAILSELWRQRQLEKLASAIRDPGKNNWPSKLDPKDLDTLLAELTIMQSRYNLYLRFLRKKISGDAKVSSGEDSRPNENVVVLENKIKSSELCRLMQELLSSYLLIEHFYMEESVRKAIAMDFIEPGNQISSMIDDVFFIVKKCIRRASVTSNIDGVCTVINNACAVLENEMCSVLQNTMRQGFPSGYLDLSQAYNVVIQGRLQTADTEQAKTLFIAHLNNTDVGNEYVVTLCTSLANEASCTTDLDRRKLESCLAELSRVSVALGAAQDLGMQQLRNTAVKPRVVTWLDSFLSLSHVLTEAEFSSYEANEPFIRALIGNIDGILSEFKSSLTPTNYETLVGLVATEVNAQFEKVILKSEFNRLGGLALDKEIRALVSYLSTATSWSVRDKFARITQIATVLNLEHVGELSDYWDSNQGMPWRLTPENVKKVMKLRVDFPVDEINRLKL